WGRKPAAPREGLVGEDRLLTWGRLPLSAGRREDQRRSRRKAMPYQVIEGIPVFGEPEAQALAQAKMCARTGNVVGVLLMVDHHRGYSQLIGSVVVYRPNQVRSLSVR